MNNSSFVVNSIVKQIVALSIAVAFILGVGILNISDVYADSTSGNVNYAAKWNYGGTAVELTVTPENAGTVYYLMQESGEDAPSESSVQESSHTDCAADSGTTIEIPSGDNNAKDIYIIYQEDGSDSSYGMSKIALPAYDNVSLTGSVSISGERNGSDKLSLSVTPTIDGTLKYIVKSASEDAPSDNDFDSASYISETAGTTKTTQISLGDDSTEAKKIYFRYYTDNGAFVAADVMDIPALDSSSFAAEISPSEMSLGTVQEGYSASDAAATATITNTGSGTVSFSVDTTADGYADFSKYFDVDTSGAEDIASGQKGSVTVTPKEGLSAGTYTGTFYLVDKIDEDNTLELGPVTVTMTVAEKDNSKVDGVRKPTGEYTPTIEWTAANDTSYIKINGSVAYCVNYYYNLSTSTDSSVMESRYKNKFGLIPDVTNKELDAYTGLGSNSNLYPPNNNNYTPVKEGSTSSTIRDDIARVLYYGYPNDALNLIADGNSLFNLNDVNNYVYCQELKVRDDFSFELATQCAIWHYTDGIDFSDIASASPSDPRVEHVKDIYQTVPIWGWNDVQNLYNFLVGNNTALVNTYGVGGTRGKFRNGVDYPSSLSDAPDDFAVDLYVADNPVYGTWTQNLVTASTTSSNTTTTDVSITKIWADQSNANGDRPDADSFKDWIRLYNGTTDVTDEYADKLTVTDNGNNTYTVSYTGLPDSGYSYTVQEEIPDDYSSSYKIPEGKNSAENGGSLKNYVPTEKTQDSSLTITKTDSDGNVLEGAKFTLYADEDCETPITDENAIDASDGTVSISTDASYLQSYLPTENNGTATVYLKETTAPTGYELSETVYPITLTTVSEEGWNSDSSEYDVTKSYTITYKNDVTLTVSDQPVTDTEATYEKLTITKVSDDGQNKLSGAVFMLYSDENCSNAITNLTTGSDGTIVIDTSSLPDGLTNPETGTNTYYLKETTAPDGYTASGDVYNIVLGTSSSSDWNSDHSAYVTTTTHTIRINGSNELRVSNTEKDATVKNSELTIMKSGADTSAALEGATFTLYSDADCTNQITADITTDSNGKAYINTSAGYLSSYLPTEDGTKTFYLKETSAPTGYLLSDTVYPITITRSTENDITTYTIESSSSSELNVEDQPNSTNSTVNSELTVYKVDGHTKQPLSDAEFTLYSDSDCTNKIQTLSGTDENGNVKINTGADYLSAYLPAEDNGESKVYLKETKAPSGYGLNDKVYTLTLGRKVTEEWNSGHTEKVKTTTYSITNNGSDAITVDDQSVVSLKVNKVWNTDPGDEVTFKLTQDGKKTDNTIVLNEGDEWNDTFEDLPKYNSDGKEITYGVVEVDGDKYYDVSYERNSDGSIKVTNSAKKIHTTVSANGTESSSDKAAEATGTSVKVVDTVSYETLDTGTQYTLEGQLMDVTDTNNIVSVGKTKTETFTPTTASGTHDVDFGTLTLTPGHTYVVYETLYVVSGTDRTKVAEHKDSTDQAQTFVVKEKEETPTPAPETPSIRTTVSADGESSTSDKAVETSDTSVKVVDKVSYENLTTGTEYTLKGQLMDVTDEDNIVSVGDAQTTTFTPAESSGTQELSLGTLDLEAGHTYVVYETLYEGDKAEGTPVAEHKDKNDKAQTVVVKSGAPSIRTTISANGEKSSSEKAVSTQDTSVRVVDTIFHKNLTVGETYTVKGRLIDLTSGNSVVSTASMTFTAENTNGSVKLDFGTVSLKSGHKYVAFEYLYEGETAEGIPVAVHRDKNEKSQTIIVTGTGNEKSTKPGNGDSNKPDNAGSNRPGNGRSARPGNGGAIRTGDNTALYYWAVLLAGTLAGLLITIRKRKTSKR